MVFTGFFLMISRHHLNSEHTYLNIGVWFPHDGVGRYMVLPPGKNLCRKLAPILREPVPDMP